MPVATPRTLLAATVCVSALGLLAEYAYVSWPAVPVGWVRAFSLSAERNVPTAFSAALMALAAWRLARVAAGPTVRRPGTTGAAPWWALASGFVLMALDELLELHERVLLRPGEGALYFGWIVPGAAIVAALGLLFVPFLRALPAPARNVFVASGALFVTGALGMEVPLGLVTEAYGVESVAYALVDWLEETFELLAIAWFAGALGRLHDVAPAQPDASPERVPPGSPASAPRSSARGGYIVGPSFDWVFLLSPPLVALLAGIAIAGSDYSLVPHVFGDRHLTWAELTLGALIHAHLVAVFVRSHANPAIRARYPVRFWVVPPVLLVAMFASPWVAALSAVTATLWDVYHSGAQTFGFARIYDVRAGHDPSAGRQLDFALNQLLYAGPILAGVTLSDHLAAFGAFDDLSLTLSMRAPATLMGYQGAIARGLFGGGAVFLALYVGYYVRRARAGARVPWQKVFLLVATGACSVSCWLWNPWGEAFFIMNLFHAVQYLAFVWAQEGPRLRARVTGRGRLGAWLGRPHVAIVAFLGAVAVYGFWAQLVSAHLFWCVTIVVSLMHFWYDGFIWSVRRGEIAA